MLGIISIEERPAAGARVAYLRRDCAWESLPVLLDDPRAFLRNAYRWGASDFAGERAIAGAAGALDAWGGRLREGLLDAQTAGNLNNGALQVDQTSDVALHLILLEHSLKPEQLNAGVGLFLLPETASYAAIWTSGAERDCSSGQAATSRRCSGWRPARPHRRPAVSPLRCT
jgi:hypothetical protein